MKRVLIALGFVLGSISCHAQLAATPPETVTITVNNSPCAAGTPASTCGYVFSLAVITGTTCPATTGTSYTALNQAAPVPQPATGSAVFNDSNEAGKTVCYVAQTVAGSQVSQPSNVAGPFNVPALPGIPQVTGTVHP